MRALRISVRVAAFIALLSRGAFGATVGTAFTYQGSLEDGGVRADGEYDLQFELWGKVIGGGQLGPTVTKEDVEVGRGVFTVDLDFGPVFDGRPVWLQIEVRPGGSTGAFTMLNPRQALTPAPYALYALNSGGGGGGGDITDVVAGTGLTGGAASGAATLAVDFSGTGSSNSASRSDHNHTSQTWIGLTGLNLYTAEAGTPIYAVQGTGVTTFVDGAGVVGQTDKPTSRGVAGAGPAIGVEGIATAATGVTAGVRGTSSSADGVGVQGIHAASEGERPGVLGMTESTSANAVGVFGSVESTSPGVGSAGVLGLNNCTGANGVGILGNHNGSGLGVWGRSVAGIGVRGDTYGASGSGVYAAGNGPETWALTLDNGGFRVASGVNAPAFVHTAVAGPGGNTCGGDVYTVLDNPYANAHHDAMLIVTRNAGPTGGPLGRAYSVFYNDGGQPSCTSGRWLIFAESGTIASGTKFNVMVISP